MLYCRRKPQETEKETMPDSKTPSDTNHPGHEQASQRESIFAVLGLATLLSTLLIYSAPVITFQTFATWDYFVGIFAETLLFATSIFSFIVILMVLIYRQFSAKVLLPFAAISYLLGVGLFLFLLTTGEENTILIYTAAIICAFGDVSLCLVWGRIFKQFDLKQALINVSAASILSGAVFWILSLISPPLRLVFFAGCALAAAFLPFSFRISNSLKDEKAVQGSEIRKTLSALGSFADFIVMTALGLLF